MSIADKLSTIAENEQKVYDAGHLKGQNEGRKEGYDIGYIQGKSYGIQEGKADQNRLFWGTFQNGGSRWNYDYAFYRNNFSDETFRPVHDIGGIFFNYAFALSPITNLKALLKYCGVALNTSMALYLSHMFATSEITYLPVIDFSSAEDTTYAFSAYNLVEIEKLIVSASTPYNMTFDGASKLKTMIVEGTIGKNGFDVIYAKSLSKESITSIMNALSPTTSGLTVTISKTAVNSAFGSTTASEWTALVASKSNWTISLIN